MSDEMIKNEIARILILRLAKIIVTLRPMKVCAHTHMHTEI